MLLMLRLGSPSTWVLKIPAERGENAVPDPEEVAAAKKAKPTAAGTPLGTPAVSQLACVELPKDLMMYMLPGVRAVIAVLPVTDSTKPAAPVKKRL